MKLNKQEIQNYIKEHFESWYEIEKSYEFKGNFEKLNNIDLNNFSDICDAILYILYIEKIKEDYRYKEFGHSISVFYYFKEWCKGLCDPICTNYYTNGKEAVDIIAKWYGLNEKEKGNCSESRCCEIVTELLYEEITSHSTIEIEVI